MSSRAWSVSLPSSWSPGSLLDGLGIDGRARPPRDDQRRGAEEELVHAIGRAVLGQLLHIEDLAVHDPDGRDRHPVPGLEDVGAGIGRPHPRPTILSANFSIPFLWAPRLSTSEAG